MSFPLLQPGQAFPAIEVYAQDGSRKPLTRVENDGRWTLVVVYRGKHCPICTKYLNQISERLDEFNDLNIDVVAVSADSQAQLNAHMSDLNVQFPLFFGLQQAQMRQLGLYVSEPRNDQETDHNFAEPGLFVAKDDGELMAVDVANNPFCRPNLDTLLMGLKFVRDNDYPTRGTASA